MTIFIYGLGDPFTYQCRYIGQSNKPLRRYDEHLDDDDDTLKCEWIRGLKRRGVKPFLVIFESCSDEQAGALEQEYIRRYSRTPWGLTNSTFTGVKRVRRHAWLRMSWPIVDKWRMIELTLVGLLLMLIFVAVGGY